jgi:hypothetical protein
MHNPTTQPQVASHPHSEWAFSADPWPEPVSGQALLDEIASFFRAYVVLPPWAPEALALWTLHTYAFHLRDVTAYVGIESPQKRCGKSTLLHILSALVQRPVVSANISPPAFFRVIEETQPTLLIDEADTFLRGNDELRGILNSGYTRSTAFVVRVASQPAQNAEAKAQESGAPQPTSALALFSSWCPKAMAAIGRLPDTLADRCLLIRMHRKTPREKCQRLRNLRRLAEPARRKCARFVADHSAAIADACPEIPDALNDRAADIWEPLFALADLAGGPWPALARRAALALTEAAHETSPVGSLFLDIFVTFTLSGARRIFTRDLILALKRFPDHSWAELTRGKPITDVWLSQQLRPYAIRPRSLRIGDVTTKGYLREDFDEVFKRYIPRAEIEALCREAVPVEPEDAPGPGSAPPPASDFAFSI